MTLKYLELSRINDLAQGKPKCLMPVNGTTILDLQLDFFARNNIKKIHMFLGYGSDQVIRHLASRHDLEFVFYVESRPKGTAGELLSKLVGIDENIIVVHGDLYLDFPIQEMLDEINDPRISFIQLVHPSNHMGDSDIVETDETGNIIAIRIKPHHKDLVIRNQCNAGVFVFSKSWLRRISDVASKFEGDKIDLDRELIPGLLASGLKGRAHRNIGTVRDLGTPERLSQFTPYFNVGDSSYLKPMIFLDRDGVINQDSGWISRSEDFNIYADVPEAISILNQSGFRIVVVTNQPVVARGEISLTDLNYLHSILDMKLAEQDAFIDEYFVCPHHPDSGFVGEIKELKIACDCRKPDVGLLVQALKKFPTNIQNSWMIGDSWRDLEAATRMKINFIQVDRELKTTESLKQTPVFSNLLSAVNHLLKI